jgi:hypothetical protein
VLAAVDPTPYLDDYGRYIYFYFPIFDEESVFDGLMLLFLILAVYGLRNGFKLVSH